MCYIVKEKVFLLFKRDGTMLLDSIMNNVLLFFLAYNGIFEPYLYTLNSTKIDATKFLRNHGHV